MTGMNGQESLTPLTLQETVIDEYRFICTKDADGKFRIYAGIGVGAQLEHIHDHNSAVGARKNLAAGMAYYASLLEDPEGTAKRMSEKLRKALNNFAQSAKE